MHDDPFTQIGEWALGAAYDYFGSRRDGGMAERLWVPEANLVPVPAHVPLLHAAVVEPAAVALHAVHKLRVPASGSVLVIGAGPIGALAAQWLRILGWTRVIVADVDARKLDVMRGLGFEVLDAAAADAVAEARARTGGLGVDAAVEASGLPATFLQCLEVTAPQGQVLVLGDLKGDVTISRALISSLIRRELTVLGTWNSKITPAGRSEWDMVVEHIAAGTLRGGPADQPHARAGGGAAGARRHGRPPDLVQQGRVRGGRGGPRRGRDVGRRRGAGGGAVKAARVPASPG